jgi:hypothetical protein
MAQYTFRGRITNGSKFTPTFYIDIYMEELNITAVKMSSSSTPDKTVVDFFAENYSNKMFYGMGENLRAQVRRDENLLVFNLYDFCGEYTHNRTRELDLEFACGIELSKKLLNFFYPNGDISKTHKLSLNHGVFILSRKIELVHKV